MTRRSIERLGGALIACLGAGLTWTTWTALRDGKAVISAAFAGPAFVVMGTALILIPGYRTERLARGEDISGLSGLGLLTARWKIVLAVALAATGGFYFLTVF